MIFLYIVLAIIVIFVGKFLIYFFTLNNFFNSIISAYITNRKDGNSRYDCNRMIITQRITGNSSFSISDKSKEIINRFDVADTIQFLLWFNNSLISKFETIPKLSSSNLNNNRRQNLLNTSFKKEQWAYLNGIPDFRNNSLDLFDDFKELGSLLIKDFDLFYRIQK